MKVLVLVSLLCLALVCHNSNASPAKIKSGGSRGSSRGSSTSWSSRPASNPSSSSSSRYNTHSSNTALSYPKPSAPEISRTQPVSHSYPSANRGTSGGSPSYPASPGLSGGSHGYPASPGLSGGSHAYPASPGLSGGSHAYPASPGLSGGSHSYPASPGASGGNVYRPYSPGSASYPSNTGSITSSNVKPNYNAPTNSKPAYPSSNTGLSGGSPSYPSGTGLSGNTNVKPNYNAQPSYPSGSGLSGNKPSYPSSNTGLSGSSAGGHITNTNVKPNYAPPPYSPPGSPGGYHPYSHNAPPPPYSPGAYGGGYHAPPAYGGYHPQPSYFGGGVQAPPNYPSFTPNYQPVYVAKSSSGLGLAGSAAAGILSGLAAYNLARAIGGSGSRHVYHHYDNNNPNNPNYNSNNPNNNNDPYRYRDQPPPPPVAAKELSNCTLTVKDDKGTNVILIPCEIATSFAPDVPKANTSMPIQPPPPVIADGKEVCTISVMRNGKNEDTSVPCDFLTNLSKNVTQPEPIVPRISCLEAPEGNKNDPNFTPCQYVDILKDEESLKVIPLSNKIDDTRQPASETTTMKAPEETTQNTKMLVEPILMD